MANMKMHTSFSDSLNDRVEVDIDGDGRSEAMIFGYPRGWAEAQGNTRNGILNLVDLNVNFVGTQNSNYVCNSQGADFCAINQETPPIPGGPRYAVLLVLNGSSISQNCFAYYYQATSPSGPIQSGFNAGNFTGAGTVVTGC